MTSNNNFWYRANGNKDYVDQLVSSDQRKDLIIKLKLYIKSCLACYFSLNKPLTGQSGNTEQDGAVFELCSILEYYLSHRIKSNVSLWTLIQMLPQLASKNNLIHLELTKSVNWKEEFEYIFSLSEITTDLGRTRAFIRRSLNESHLNQSFELISTSPDVLKNYYEEGSILKFKEESDLFRSLLVSLQTIPFQVDYNDNNLNQVLLQSPLQEQDQISTNSEQSLNSFEVNNSNTSNNSVESTMISMSEKPKVPKKKIVKSLTRNIDLDGNDESGGNEIIESEQQTQKIIIKKVVKRIKVKKPVQNLSSSVTSTTDLTSSTTSLNSSTSSISSNIQSLDSSQTSIPVDKEPTSIQSTPPPTPIQTPSIPIEPTVIELTISQSKAIPINNEQQLQSPSSSPSHVHQSNPIVMNKPSSPSLPIALPIMKQSKYSSAYVPSKPTTPVLSSSLSSTPPMSSPISLSTPSSPTISQTKNTVNIELPSSNDPLSQIPTQTEIKNLDSIDEVILKEKQVIIQEQGKANEKQIVDLDLDLDLDVDVDVDLDDIQNTLDQIEDFLISENPKVEEEIFRDEDESDFDEEEIEENKEPIEESEENEIKNTQEISEEVELKQETKENKIIIESEKDNIKEEEEKDVQETNYPVMNVVPYTPPVELNNSQTQNINNNFIKNDTTESLPIDIKNNDKAFTYIQEENEYIDSDDEVSIGNNSFKNQGFNVNDNYYSNSYNSNGYSNYNNNNNNNSFRIKSSSSTLSFVNSDELEEYSEDVVTSNMLSSTDSVYNFNDYELLNDPEILEFIESSKGLPDVHNINQSPKSPNNSMNNLSNSGISNNPNEIKFIDDYSLDENQVSKQQYSQAIKEEPKEFKWMPPRKRLFFNIQKPITLKEQNSLCAGCARDISGLFTAHRQCQYSGKHYCTHCHNKSVYYIPGQIITSWSFKMSPISTFYLEFLKDIEKDPLFDLSSLNAKLYKNQELLRIRNLRKQMFYIKDFLSTCSDGKALMSLVEGNEYLCNDVEYFSLYDLVNHKQLLKNLRLLVAKWLNHVEKCPLCMAKGSYCEFCNDTTPIFPFHISRTTQCAECKSFHHKNCYIKSKCPKCLRIAKRKILSNFDLARKTEQHNTFITSKTD